MQILHDRVVKFNARGPDGLINGKAPGKKPSLNDEQRKALAAIVENGPTPYLHNIVRWRCKDLTLWLFEEFGIKISVDVVGRELRMMNYRELSTRPRHHKQEPMMLDDFKKVRRPSGANSFRPRSRMQDRNLAPGRSARQPEDKAIAPMGQTRDTAIGDC